MICCSYHRFSFTSTSTIPSSLSRCIDNSSAPAQVLLAFAGVLLFSSFKLLTAEDEDEDEDLTDNFIVKFCRCWMGQPPSRSDISASSVCRVALLLW
jgi:hypothetical protein